MYRILITDDEEKIRMLIRKYALFEGHQVFEASNGMDAVEMCKKQKFDIIIMDIMMPELDGFSAVREIRKSQDTPVLMLSARGEEYDKIHGFELGADDYVVKPFSPKELMMRLEAIMKRTTKGSQFRHELFVKEGLKADFTARRIMIDGSNIELPPKAFDLIFYMIRNQNIALTREKLITEVWGYEYCGDDRTLDTHIKLLRKSLGQYANLITTLRGVGYRFEG
ncbi:response regulator transcription factor [Candidatus Contubernalis alkaliaceticus]|uniref:response regulator transcription factor n=1 Tax=Candidatus Contubernalis alkaliaceticus TaxID=338645 RepID=UPI001F4C25FA|nr:response regulator transcription factor [Candidatus Contubernalis alkalaceticus]UNC91045.1 response regulator transcription factor [Candidatus Contubernalis alkalaceticus]